MIKLHLTIVWYLSHCRTVINGLCYLATFVYGINSFGLLLYSGQLAFNTYEKGSSSGKKIESKIMENRINSNKNEDQSSNNSQWWKSNSCYYYMLVF